MKRFAYRFSTVKLNSLIYNNNKPWSLVVLHGFLGSHRNFRSLMKNQQLNSLVDVHMLDNRNHGDSPHATQHSYKHMAGDLKRYIDENTSQNVIIMGHSMGGGVVYTFSALFPETQNRVKQLIVIDMPVRIVDRTTNENIINSLAKIDLSEGRDKVMRRIEQIGKVKTISDFLKTNIRTNSNHKLEWIPNVPVLQANYSNIVSQVLSSPTKWTNNIDIMYGSKSNMCNKYQCQKLRDFYPNFTEDNIHEIEEAGHWVHFDNHVQFMQTLLEIVKANVEANVQ